MMASPRLARANAELRYAPQRQALAQLAAEARRNYLSSIEGARSESRLLQNALAQAVPATGAIYDRAASTDSGAASRLAAVLAGLGGAGAPFQAAAATETAAGTQRLAGERAAAEAHEQAQRDAAVAAPAYARTLATGQLNTTLAKLAAQYQGLAGQEGTDIATELGRQEREDRKDALTRRGQDITARSDAESHALMRRGQDLQASEHAEALRAKRTAALTPSLLPQSEQAKGAGELARIRELAQVGFGAGHNYGQVHDRLTKGTPSVTVEGVKTQGQKPFSPGPLLDAGIELARYGTISRQTLGRLHSVGYSVKALGARVRSEPRSPGAVGRHVKAALGF
jgi:hypothetical protein